MANRKKECENKEVMTSRIFTLAPRKTSAFQENILIEVIKIAQKQLEGKSLKELVGEARQLNEWGDMWCTIHIDDIADPNLYKNYKKALEDLTEKRIIYESAKTLLVIPMLQRVVVDKGTAEVGIQIAKEIWDCILDFTKRNASLYDPQIALALPTVGAKRMYEMIANTKPGFVHEWSMDELNKIFKTNYSGGHFRTRVLEPAKKYLDDIADWSFNFYPIPSDEEWAEMHRRGKRPITGYRVAPYQIHRGDETDRNAIKKKLKKSNSYLTPPAVRDWLMFQLGFTSRGLSSNDMFFFTCVRRLGDSWEICFENLYRKMRGVRKAIPNPRGYFIALLSKECGVPTERNRAD